MAKSPPIQMTVMLTPVAHRRLFESAGAKGYKASAYAQMLFDAAFAARIGQERGEPASDAELDEQVRLVFACAGQGDTAAIARATGVPEARVVRILEAWKDTGSRPPRAADGGYPVELIRTLWAEGMSAKDIAARIGRSVNAFEQWVSTHRDVCPKRRT
jgi:hypothetical protein